MLAFGIMLLLTLTMTHGLSLASLFAERAACGVLHERHAAPNLQVSGGRIRQAAQARVCRQGILISSSCGRGTGGFDKPMTCLVLRQRSELCVTSRRSR